MHCWPYCACFSPLASPALIRAVSDQAQIKPQTFGEKRPWKGHCCIGYTVVVWIVSSGVTTRDRRCVRERCWFNKLEMGRMQRSQSSRWEGKDSLLIYSCSSTFPPCEFTVESTLLYISLNSGHPTCLVIINWLVSEFRCNLFFCCVLVCSKSCLEMVVPKRAMLCAPFYRILKKYKMEDAYLVGFRFVRCIKHTM